jgi:hypothetical protein
MSQVKNKFLFYLNVMLVLLILIFVFSFSFLNKDDTISTSEKRKLAEMPGFSSFSFFSSTYEKAVEKYYEDHFPLRNELLKISGFFSNIKGNTVSEGKLYSVGPTEKIPEKDKADFSEWAEKEEIKFDTTHISFDEYGEMVNNLFIYKKHAYQLFGGSDAVAEIFASSLNELKKALGDSITLYNLTIPSPAEFYLPDKYKSLSNSEKHNLETINNNLDASIIDIDAYSEIAKHTDEYLYFATDHHWTVMGAYYAYRAFSKSAGFLPLSNGDMKMVTKKNYLGSLYLLTLDASLASNPDSVCYYQIPGNYSVYWDSCSIPPRWYPGALIVDYPGLWATYGVFLGADYAAMKIETSNYNNRRILVLKESFGNAFVPFLVPHYEKVFVADIRYFHYSLMKFIQEYKINEVLVIMSDISANNTYFGYRLRNMPYSGYDLHY